MIKNALIAVSLLTLALSGSALSDTIGNGPPNQTGGSDLNSFLEADNFSLSMNSLVSQVTYWSLQTGVSDYAGMTAWSIYSDASGAPGSALFSGLTAATGAATGNTTLGLAEYMYSFSLSVTLAPGDYWLVLHNGAFGTDPSTSGSQYYWAWSNATMGDSQSEYQGDTMWYGNATELAFNLTTSPAGVPESGGTLALLGLGLCALALAQRARRTVLVSN